MALATENSSSLSAHQITDGRSTSDQKSVKRSKVTQQQIYQMLSMYENPAYKVHDIAKSFGFSVPVLYHYLDKSGVPYERRGKRSHRVTEKQSAQIRALAASGVNRKLIAEHTGVALSTVFRHIKANQKKTKPAAIKPTPAPQYKEQELEYQVAMTRSPSLWQRFKTWLFG